MTGLTVSGPPIRATVERGQPAAAAVPRPEVETIRRPYTFAATVPAAGSDVLLMGERLRENARVVHISVDFADGVAQELLVYPIISFADAPAVVGVDEYTPYEYLLEGPMHYLAGDDVIWRLDVAIPAPEGTFLGFRAVNENAASELTYRAVLVTEESYRVSA